MVDAPLETHEKDGLPILRFADARAFEEWLEGAHASSSGIWIKVAKKASGIESIDWPQIVETALCFGWIDGLRRGYDEAHFVQRVTPRRPRSIWSERNVAIVERLISEGRMRGPGLEQVARAKADGRWAAAFGTQSANTVPDDLLAILDADPALADLFAGLGPPDRRAFLFRLQGAKRPETRERRLAMLLGRLRSGESLREP